MNDNDIYYYGINGYGVTDGYYSELYSEIGKFIVDNIDENIDINKNYKYITINNDYDKNIFVTNRVEELDKIMEKYVNDNDDDISDAEIARVMQMKQIMINLDYQSRTPIYEQIVNGIEKYVAVGILKEKVQIPSIREMASNLGINPNTVKKSYDILENRGVITTISTKGTFISENTKKTTNDKIDREIENIKKKISKLTRMGISFDEVIERIKK